MWKVKYGVGIATFDYDRVIYNDKDKAIEVMEDAREQFPSLVWTVEKYNRMK